MQAPAHTIAANAGVEGAVVVGKLLEQDDPDLGYDAAKGNRYFHNDQNTGGNQYLLLLNRLIFLFILLPRGIC